MTRMACENNNMEAEGTAIMAKPMTITESGDRLSLSSRVGTIELTSRPLGPAASSSLADGGGSTLSSP